MDKCYSFYTEKQSVKLDTLEAEILHLQQKLVEEETPTVLNDIRLRLGFLQWKRELLQAAYGQLR